MMKLWAQWQRSLIVVLALHSLMVANPAESAVSPSWADVSLDKRCEGLLEFLKARVAKELSAWSLKKPQCVISGSVVGDAKWTLDVILQQANKSFPFRVVIDEPKGRKPSVVWCLTKGELSACANPWDNTFALGDLYPKAQDAKAAYDNLIKNAPGLLGMVTTLDAWTGKQGKVETIFGVEYTEWINELFKSLRKLPTKDGDVSVDFNPERENVKIGTVQFKGVIPQSLRECLGCGKTACEKSIAGYEFSGIGLSLARRLTPEEQKTYGSKFAKASWILTEKSPASANQAKWPLLCGEHRFNIQKF